MIDDPLTSASPVEVPLPESPLVRVIAQIRFPLVASIEKREFMAPFQEAIRGEYALLRQEAIGELLANAPGHATMEMRLSNVWRFRDLEHGWRVTLAANFMALETSCYVSRTDFFDRFSRLLTALEQHVKPGALDRLGVRYIDRLTGPPLGRLGDFIHPALLGALGTSIEKHALLAVSEGLFKLPNEGGQMRARWGVVPANMTVDPNTIEPIGEPSWILDIDAFLDGERAFIPGEIAEQAETLARRAYSFFRWAVTDHFLRHCGGAP